MDTTEFDLRFGTCIEIQPAGCNEVELAPALDAALHAERAIPRRRTLRRHDLPMADLPEGAVLLDGLPKLVLADRLLPVHPDGYGPPEPRPASGSALVLTPPTTRRALRNGYRPALHPTSSF